ncbi:DUF5931 domain-containing protein [Mariniluteicoccus endophyticus]
MTAPGPARRVPAPTARRTATAVDPVEPFFRILLALRWVTLALTLLTDGLRMASGSPLLVAAGCILMIAATVFATWVSVRRPAWRARAGWIEVGVALVVLVLTPFALPVELRIPPLTGFWVAAGPVAVILAGGWGQGLAASLLLGIVAQVVEPELSVERWGLTLALIIGVVAFGWSAQMIRDGVHEREDMRATNAALAERQRLARIVHDGVLQVLAMVEREGAHLGPRGAMLARHAHEQEAQLRALIQQTDIDPDHHDPRDVTHRNFAVMLDRHESGAVTVSTPVEPLLMESARAAELDAAVTEALSNVAKHAGPDARAWVFLEIEGSHAIVSVRDNGVGGDPNKFAEAMRSGRMGMKHSIYGRIHELGGTATLRTAPGRGVEWEFRIPVEV